MCLVLNSYWQYVEVHVSRYKYNIFSNPVCVVFQNFFVCLFRLKLLSFKYLELFTLFNTTLFLLAHKLPKLWHLFHIICPQSCEIAQYTFFVQALIGWNLVIFNYLIINDCKYYILYLPCIINSIICCIFLVIC